MKTEDLIDMLARQAGPARRHQVVLTLAVAVGAGALISLALVSSFKAFIPRDFWFTFAPWLKVSYGIALGAAGLWWTSRLARPGVSQTSARIAVLAALTAMLSLAVGVWVNTPPEARLASVMGTDPLGCVRDVALAAVPVAIALFLGLQRLAPTRLRSAGTAAGLAAGAIGSAVYSLSCTETAVAFVAVWYTAGVFLVAGLGAVIGPRVLRW